MEINKIYQGDCLDIMTRLEDKSIDMILCDLPYGTTACSWDTIIPFELLWNEYKRIIKDGGAIILTASQPFTSTLVMSNPTWFRHEWIWEKDRGANFLQGNKQPMKVHENVLVFGKTAPNYYPIKTKNINKKTPTNIQNKEERKKAGLTVDTFKSSDKYEIDLLLPRTVMYYKRENGNAYVHPTQKPVELFMYLVDTYTKKGELVLDNCAGSGTTGVACKNLGRNFILIEKEEKYCKIAQERLDKMTQQLF